ncbi:trans-2-enoyl-CoA reductase family protein [Paenibacillus oenotherae]|uniref:Trans-2-enoyl-CoA reductase [NADH] n=1 Tax=Paenibacillus oenotherae TaxID=1435645 RepID=A0ABS7DBJ8_9BACL|nr:enoyl-ACP reductase FabV [Paenibacillus oenotherae]MBW7477307.1 trans-2-enoyl-CoA reductase family protein [Paenibacillus oenotherae]
MIIAPAMRGYISTTAHPVGCALQVQQQRQFVERQPFVEGARRVLVIGGSMGYGLATCIVSTFGMKADTITVCLEREPMAERPASAGWYHNRAWQSLAAREGRHAETLFGDAFSEETKRRTILRVKEQFGQLDLIVYSLAAPRRSDPLTGQVYTSVLKTIGEPYTNKTVHIHTGEVGSVTLQPATAEEIAETVQVMGGSDWEEWVEQLEAADAIAQGAVTLAYSYVGTPLFQEFYRGGTIGRAKDHLEATAHQLDARLTASGGRAYTAVMKALITQSSAAIPISPLYTMLLFRIMREQNVHEGCIEQVYRLMSERLYAGETVPVDDQGRIRLDEKELLPEIQEELLRRWSIVETSNLEELADFEEYRRQFMNLFGFAVDGVDYEADVDPALELFAAEEVESSLS